MYWTKLIVCVVAFCAQASSIPVGEWDVPFFDEASEEQRLTNASSSTSEFAQELGISEQFLKELKQNWEKAVEEEKQKGKDRLRQAGGIGEFFGLGNGGAGGGVGGGGLGGTEEDEDDDEDAPATPPGAGAAGILTGLFGIFSGIGSLNPQRVIQSTVNFFPPHQRVAAQMALDAAFGIHNATTPLPPLTDAPAMNGTKKTVPVLQTVVSTTTTKTDSVPTTLASNAAEDTTRRKLVLKETTLLEDFEEAAVKLNPIVVDVDTDIPDETNGLADRRLSSVETDFADTANSFKIPSVNENKGTSHEDVVANFTNVTPVDVAEISTVKTEAEIEEISTIAVKPEIVTIIVRVAE